jgi:hypothetical protein
LNHPRPSGTALQIKFSKEAAKKPPNPSRTRLNGGKHPAGEHPNGGQRIHNLHQALLCWNETNKQPITSLQKTVQRFFRENKKFFF